MNIHHKSGMNSPIIHFKRGMGRSTREVWHNGCAICGPDIDGIASVFQAIIHPIPHTTDTLDILPSLPYHLPQVLDFIADALAPITSSMSNLSLWASPDQPRSIF
jgi:hypothetical protein